MTPIGPAPPAGPPRIAPGGRREIGLLNAALARLSGLAAGTNPPRLVTTFGRHRWLLRRWLVFAGALMPGGKLPREDTELVILRVASLHECAYEWVHHEHLAARAGLDAAAIARVRTSGPEDPAWTPRQALLLRATDELHHDRVIGDETWAGLAAILTEQQLIELCLLVGHYAMLATTFNTIGVQPDVRRR